MKLRLGSLLVASVLLVSCIAPDPYRTPDATAPFAPVEPVTETHGATTVVDPYRWMERGAADARFLPLLRAQNAYRTTMMAPLAAQHDALLRRLTALANGAPHVSAWKQAGGRLFYEEGGTPVVARLRVLEANGTKRTIFDPATFGEPKRLPYLVDYYPSLDGTRVAIGVSLGRSQLVTLRVIDTSTGAPMADAIDRCDFTAVSWRDDGASFYYTRLQRGADDATETARYENMRAYLHVLGRDPDTDHAVFGPGVPGSPPLRTTGFNAVWQVPGTPMLYATNSYQAVSSPNVYVSRSGGATWQLMISAADRIVTGGLASIAIRGTTLYALLWNVPNGQILAYDLSDLSKPPAIAVAASASVLEGVFATKGAVYVASRDGLRFALDELDGKNVPLPYAGTLGDVDASETESGLRFGLTSWTQSLALFRYDETTRLATNTGVVPPDPSGAAHVVVREVLVASTDGARVPVSIILRDDAVLDATHPTIVTGYGAYASPLDSAFETVRLEWVRRGGIIAFAHVRGGGEYGERWHIAGQKATKQHSVDDLIAASRYLIAHRYTSTEHLAVSGFKAGGIIAMNAVDQHPELFAAAVDDAGTTNLVREAFTRIGRESVDEFGDANVPDNFSYMYRLDAYQHVRDATPYPAVFGITSARDRSVTAWVALKMISRLQTASNSGKPIVLRTEFDAPRRTDAKYLPLLEAKADEWTFLLWQLGDPAFRPRR